jgi:hypothetical protein
LVGYLSAFCESNDVSHTMLRKKDCVISQKLEGSYFMASFSGCLIKTQNLKENFKNLMSSSLFVCDLEWNCPNASVMLVFVGCDWNPQFRSLLSVTRLNFKDFFFLEGFSYCML